MIFRRRLHPANLGVHPADRRLVTIGATDGFRQAKITRMEKLTTAVLLAGFIHAIRLSK